MKNPFLNTHKYAVVRQYGKLKARSRTKSNNSRYSIQSSRQRNQYFHLSDSLTHNIKSPQIEYGSLGSNRHQIQQKSAKIYGIQELRYKPAYLNQLTPHQQPSSTSIKPSLRKQFRKPSLINMKSSKFMKSQKQMKSIKSMKSVKKITDRMIQGNDQIKEKQVKINRIDSTDSHFLSVQNFPKVQPKRRKSSILETMIIIGDSGKQNNTNNFYQSFHHLDCKRKTSLQRQANQSQIIKKKNSNSIISQQTNKNDDYFKKSSCRWQRSSNFSQSQQYSSSSSSRQQNQAPQSILVRQKLYFRHNVKY